MTTLDCKEKKFNNSKTKFSDGVKNFKTLIRKISMSQLEIIQQIKRTGNIVISKYTDEAKALLNG